MELLFGVVDLDYADICLLPYTLQDIIQKLQLPPEEAKNGVNKNKYK